MMNEPPFQVGDVAMSVSRGSGGSGGQATVTVCTKPPFEMGDVVSLKSGFCILMTVERCRPHKGGWLVDTIWFDHNSHIQRDCFDAVSLQQWKAVDADPT